MSLELHAGDSPTKFISDWRECLQRLSKQRSLLPLDTDTLHALLLLANQDDLFESVRDDILKYPKKSIDDILSGIQVCNFSYCL